MANWREYFAHDDANQYFEFLLGDPGYVGADMLILRRVGSNEISQSANMEVVSVFNKMHAGRRIKVEWGIGGLKRKF
jgi:hypothetical protein